MHNQGNILALPQGYLLNHLVIKSVIGQGGFGITYLAEDVHTREEVAVKELWPPGGAYRDNQQRLHLPDDPSGRELALAIEDSINEAKIIIKLNHPNLVRMLEFFEQNATAYLVMPYIHGEDLKTLSKRMGPLSEADTLSIITQLSGAVQHMHQANILHRDIKPDNVIIRAGSGEPVLLDFGASRQNTTAVGESVTSLVSSGYTPIELYSTDSTFQGTWSDVYSLAALAYFLSSGVKPPDSVVRSTTMERGQADPCVPLHQLSHIRVSQGFSQKIMGGLSVKERDRPQTVTQWLQLLKNSPTPAATTPQPVRHVAPPPAVRPQPVSPRQKNTSNTRRNILLITTIFALIAILGGTIALLSSRLKSNSSNSKSITKGLPAAVRGGHNTPPQPRKPATTTSVRKFIQNYYADENSGQQAKYFASSAHYFDKQEEHHTIAEAIRIYGQTWPSRSCEPGHDIQITKAGDDAYQVTATYKAKVNNGICYRDIRGVNRFTLRLIRGEMKITSIRFQKSRDDIVTFNKDKQYQSLVQLIRDYLSAGDSSTGSNIRQLNFFTKKVVPYFGLPTANHAEISQDLNKYATSKPNRKFGLIRVTNLSGLGSDSPKISVSIWVSPKSASDPSRGITTNYLRFSYRAGLPFISAINNKPLR